MSTSYCPYCRSKLDAADMCPTCDLNPTTYVVKPHHLPPGTMLMDRYQIGRVLGEGGFGITYLAIDGTLERRVAIKEYFPNGNVTRDSLISHDVTIGLGNGKDDAFQHGMKRFLAEARTMARMTKQPSIVGVQDFFEQNATAYIVMEYVQGTTLLELANQHGGRIAYQELFPTIEPLFDALLALHNSGLLHRDISPDNIMLEDGVVRLLDFGCARDGTDGTETMTVMLKYDYAPLEQYNRSGQGPWTDVYALSATMYRCLCGQPPTRALDRINGAKLLSPSQLGVHLPESVERGLLRGLALKAADRPQSMAEFRALLYGETVEISPAEPESAPTVLLDKTLPVGEEDMSLASVADNDFERAVKQLLQSPYHAYHVVHSVDSAIDALNTLVPAATSLGTLDTLRQGQQEMALISARNATNDWLQQSEAQKRRQEELLAPRRMERLLMLIDSIGKGSPTARMFAVEYGPTAPWLWMVRNASLYICDESGPQGTLERLSREVPRKTDDMASILARGDRARDLCLRIFKAMDTTPLPAHLGYSGGGIVHSVCTDAVPCAEFYGQVVPRGFVRSLLNASPETPDATWHNVALLSQTCRHAALKDSGFVAACKNQIDTWKSVGEHTPKATRSVMSDGVAIAALLYALINEGVKTWAVSYLDQALGLLMPPLQKSPGAEAFFVAGIVCALVFLMAEFVINTLILRASAASEKTAAMLDDLEQAGHKEVSGFCNGTSDFARQLANPSWDGPIENLDIVGQLAHVVGAATKWFGLRKSRWYAILWHATSALPALLLEASLVAMIAVNFRDGLIDYFAHASADSKLNAKAARKAAGIGDYPAALLVGIFAAYALQTRDVLKRRERDGRSWIRLLTTASLLAWGVALVACFVFICLSQSA